MQADEVVMWLSEMRQMLQAGGSIPPAKSRIDALQAAEDMIDANAISEKSIR